MSVIAILTSLLDRCKTNIQTHWKVTHELSGYFTVTLRLMRCNVILVKSHQPPTTNVTQTYGPRNLDILTVYFSQIRPRHTCDRPTSLCMERQFDADVAFPPPMSSPNWEWDGVLAIEGVYSIIDRAGGIGEGAAETDDDGDESGGMDRGRNWEREVEGGGEDGGEGSEDEASSAAAASNPTVIDDSSVGSAFRATDRNDHMETLEDIFRRWVRETQDAQPETADWTELVKDYEPEGSMSALTRENVDRKKALQFFVENQYFSGHDVSEGKAGCHGYTILAYWSPENLEDRAVTREPNQGDPGKPGGHQAHKGKSISRCRTYFPDAYKEHYPNAKTYWSNK
ncbi:hypothetical protein BV22DRAFT_1051025, partial [Leucogyrophana mollusca]